MTDRFSHPLTMGFDHDERVQQSSNRASFSSRVSRTGGPPEKALEDTQSGKSSDLPASSAVRKSTHSLSFNPGCESSATVHTRSRASTTSRARIPRALQGIGREELEIYQYRWDLMDNVELVRVCGAASTGPPPSPLRTHSDSTLPPVALDARSIGSTEVPSLSRSSSSLSSPSTPRARPRTAKRYSTQILALTLPTVEAQPVASGSRANVGGLFPPSPPSDAEFGTLRREGEEASGHDRSGLALFTDPVDRQDTTDRHPLRVLSKIARELGEACLKLEEENEVLRGKLEVTGDESDVFTPRRASSSTGRALLAHEDLVTDAAAGGIVNKFMEEDQLSIHDSLNEALSTSLASPTTSSVSASHYRPNYDHGDPLSGPGDDADDDHSVTLKVKAERSQHLLYSHSPARSGLASPHPSRTRLPAATGRNRSGSTSTNASRQTRAPTIVVRSTASETTASDEQAVLDGDLLGTIPLPKNKKHRSSWTDSLWGWTGGTESSGAGRQHRSGSTASRNNGESTGTSHGQAKRSRASTVASESVLPGQVTRGQPDDSSSAAGDEDQSFRLGDGSNTPTFRAIFLATRLLTPDESSILSTASKHRRDGDLIRRMAYKLVRNARDSGITLRSAPETTRLIRSTSPLRRPAERSGKGGNRHSVLGLPSTIGTALASPVHALLGGSSGGNSTTPRSTAPETAKSQLLRSISNRDMAGTLNRSGLPVKGKSPDRSVASTPLVSPGDDGDFAPPFVEMDAFVADRDKPPTMLPRRNTLHNLHGDVSPSFKLASRFGEESAELAPYTDKFGFVYDLRYVRLLLDLKAASEEDTLGVKASTEEEDMPQVKRDLWRSMDDDGLDRVPSTTSPYKSPDSEAYQPLPRPRSTTVATFSPSPAKASASQQDVTVSSRGAIDLRPSIATNGGRKDSVRDQKAKLDLLAVRHRKPVSALLHQLGEVQDVREAETAKQWEQFIKYRRGKKSRKGSVSHKHRPASRLEGGLWQDDLVGIADMGDGKTGQEVMKKFKALIVSSGIPISLRASIWAECSGAKDAFIPGEYHEILSVHKHDKHSVLGDIEKDVKRTFPTNVFFGGDGVGCEKLRRLLTAYAWHDPSVGYCQGMNLVAATLLLIYEDEERAYWTFVCLIRNLLPREWFTRTLQGSMTEQAVLAELVAEHLPRIDRHFAEIGLDLSAVTFGWMLSLFTSCLPIETVLRIWDCFMIEGKDVIIRSALAILKMGQGGIVECDNVGDLFDYLNAITERLWSPDKLIQTQDTLKLTTTTHDLAARRQKHAETNASGSL